MNVPRLPADVTAVRRFLEDLWVPYVRGLETNVDSFALSDGVDLVAEELEFWIDRLETEDFQVQIAIDGSYDTNSLAESDGDFVGFVSTEIDECPSSFDRPDRLVISDFYVNETYRGTRLARTLIDRARARAHESGCDQFKLEVDVDNDRARAFYEKLGFEPYRCIMVADIEE